VPVAIKDSIPVSGEPMRIGSAASSSVPQTVDHPLVARLRAAGAVVVGLTNLPELAIYPFTDSAYGVTRNPWDRRRTSGGSSGGSAAAVASAMVPLAHGTDGLGSIRIPAAACGVFGIKPGLGLVPADVGVDSWMGLLENGVLASTVADATRMLEVIAGASFEPVDLQRLRIAASVKATGPGIILNRACTRAVRQCAQLLITAGHTVEIDDPAYPLWLTPTTIVYWFAVPVPDADFYLTGSGIQARTRKHLRAGRAVLRVRPPRASDRDRLRAALAPFFERHDVLVMAALGRPQQAARRWGDGSWLRSVAASIMFAPMTEVWNMAGFPAASVPLGITAGMPVSVQLVAAPGGEAALLALAAQIESASPWPRHAPAYEPLAAAS
jgi:amidase